MHATDFMKAPDQAAGVPVIVLFGPERHLRLESLRLVVREVLGSDGDDDEDADDDPGLTRISGRDADLTSVCDELRTVSMWGDARVVAIDDADDFVSKHRTGLEKYCDHPAKKSVLVLDVRSWPKNTKLAKRVAKMGLDIECAELKGAALSRWLTDSAATVHGKKLSRDAAVLMTELAGSELGILNQELSKLSAYVGDRESITAEDVQALVGGWKAETTWAMTNATRDGDLATAIQCLDKLLNAGEAPQKVLGGINFVFRRLASATEIARTGTPLNAALKQAGVFPRDAAPSERYLRRIGRPQAEQLFNRLLTADGHMKGGSRLPERIQLEQLLVSLSGCAKS